MHRPTAAAIARVLLTCHCLVLAPTHIAFAQAAQPAPRRGSVVGIVFDSLVTNAPLPGAEVSVDGTARTAVTGRDGRFRLDSVPAGRTVVRFYHAKLDSLGFGAAPVPVDVADSGTVQTRLATPSAATLHSRLCPGSQPQSTGVLLGRVRDVDGRAPLPNADVTANWTEWTVGAGGLTRNERRAAAATDANGAFLLCGVPTDVAVVARATASGHVTGLVEIDFARRLFGVRDFAVSVADEGATTARLAQLDSLIARGDSVTAGGSATIGGVVRGADGRPLGQAQVALFGFPFSVRTGSAGAYQLTGVPAGSQTIEVRAVGYAPVRLTLDLATGERRTTDVTTNRAAQALASVNIVGRGKRLDKTGFDDRRKAGIGQFIGPEEIERRKVFDASQLLWNVAGARVVWDGSDNAVMFTRPVGTGVGGGGWNNVCHPAVFIDGFLAYGIDDIRPGDIRGIEVYSTREAAPAMYRASSPKETGRSDSHCAVILVWTKPPEPRKPREPEKP